MIPVRWGGESMRHWATMIILAALLALLAPGCCNDDSHQPSDAATNVLDRAMDVSEQAEERAQQINSGMERITGDVRDRIGDIEQESGQAVDDALEELQGN